MSRAFDAGVLRYYILSVSGSHPKSFDVTLPDSSVVTITDPVINQEGIVGVISAGNVTVTFHDNDDDFPGSWTDSVTTHCHVSPIPGGYYYEWDDSGSQGVPDGNFADLKMQLRVPNAVSDGMDEAYITVGVFKSDGSTLISWVPRRRNVKWQDEVNGLGTGSFDIHLDDQVLVDHPDLLDDYNIVKFFINGEAIFAFVIEDLSAVRVQSGEGSERFATVTGRGLMSVLENAVVYPEYGLRDLVPEDRHFNFAAADGVWRDPTEWTTPVGVKWSSEALSGRKGLPKDWSDKNAYWLWSSPGPEANVKPGKNWFRLEFTVPENTPAVIFVTADNQFTAYLDGLIIAASGTSTQAAFKTSYRWPPKSGQFVLSAGDHVFAVEGTNLGQGSAAANNPAGIIATCWRGDGAGGYTTDNIFRTTPSNTIVKAYGNPPGWNAATIIQQLIEEAQDRQVDSILPITYDFDYNYDSDGIPWTTSDILTRNVTVGTTDYSDLAQQLVETSYDLYISPDFVLHAHKRRGANLSDTVILRERRAVTAATGSRRAGRVKNQVLLKYGGGWIEIYSAVSKAGYGRREVGLSVGTADSVSQTQQVANAALREVLDAEETVPVSYTSLKGPQPYADFNLGDTILIPAVKSGMTPGRLMSISGSELGEGGAIQWDLDFYPETDDSAITDTVIPTGGTYDDVSALYAHEVLSDSPWGFWRLTEASGTTLHDISGHKRHLKTHGTPTLNQPGPVDNAVFFDNATSGGNPNDYAYSGTVKYSGFKYVTLEAWVYITQYPASGDRGSIIAMANAINGTTHDKELYIDNTGTLVFRVVNSSGAHTISSTVDLAGSKWYHVAASVGTKGMRLYINGALNRSSSAATVATTTGELVFLRAGGSGYNDVDQIRIAEPAVYYQQLLDSRIKSHFNAADYTA